jgi:rod shape determining protein RodA
VKNESAHIDPVMIILYLFLVVIGWLSIYSASSEPGASFVLEFNNNGGKQLIWMGIAFLLGTGIILMDRKFFSGFSWYLYGIGLVLLVAVLFLGKEIAGSRSWFQVGSVRFQPAEFAKMGTALALASYINRIDISLKQWPDLIKAVIIFMVPAALVVLQGDAGSALVFLAFFIVLYREGMNPWIMFIALSGITLAILTLVLGTLTLSIILGVILLVVLAFNYTQKGMIYMALLIFAASVLYIGGVGFLFDNVLKPHQQNRIMVTLNLLEDPQGVGYNVYQSKVAIGSGGFMGKGFLNGTQNKGDFVPEQSTDFIFCTVGEEFGWVGSSFVVVLYLLLITRCFRLGERQKNRFNRTYAYGVGSILFFHFLVNIGMTIGLMPVVGIPLPFMSYGGSSLLVFTTLLFILIRLDAGRESEYVSIKDI